MKCVSLIGLVLGAGGRRKEAPSGLGWRIKSINFRNYDAFNGKRDFLQTVATIANQLQALLCDI